MAYRRRILTDPDPALRKVAKKVTLLELRMPLTQQLIDDMVETMREAPGIGLAAPQVGVSKRVFVADVGEEDGEERKLYVFVNPVLTDFAGHRRLSLHPGLGRRRHARGHVHDQRVGPPRQKGARRGDGPLGPLHPARGRPPRRDPHHRQSGEHARGNGGDGGPAKRRRGRQRSQHLR